MSKWWVIWLSNNGCSIVREKNKVNFLYLSQKHVITIYFK